MKKILLFSMAAMLLSLSLNAKQASENTKRDCNAAKELQLRDNTRPKFMLNEGEYLVGPYTTDAYNASTYNMYSSWDIRQQPMLGVVLKPADFQDHIGDEIIGFRFALSNTANVYEFFCSYESDNYRFTGDSWTVTLGNSSSQPAQCDRGWNTYYLQEGIDFEVADTITEIWIGYQYAITTTNVVAVNANSTGHEDRLYGYDNYYGEKRWYDMSSKLGGDLAIQLIFRPKSQPGFEGYTELPGTFGDDENIDFKGLDGGIMFCDQPWGKTHANNHPAKYTYWLEEVIDANSSEDPHKTNSIDIPVYKTGSDVRGYYNLSEIASDTDHHLQVDVLNADVDLSLQNESMIYYYTLDRGKTTLPSENNCIAHLQNNANGNFYTEMSNALGYQGETYTATVGNPALIDRWDHINVETGEHNQDYMAYIPVIWSWGDGTFDNKRNDWDNNGVHNSYGSPYYKTGVGDVSFNAGTKIIAQTGTGSTAVWKDGDDDCCLYNVIIDATGYLPTTVNTVDYEPYMFRVWVEGNGLRDYVYENNQFLPADTHPTEILLYEGEYVDNGTGEIRLSVGSTGSDYSQWIKFGGLQNFTPTLRVRFYYKVPSDNVTSLRGGGRDFYAVEESGYQPNSETGIIETIGGAQVVGVTFVNMQGMQSSKPFDGVNIMVTRYSDGTTTTTKVIK